VTRPRVLFVTQDFPPAIGGIQTYSLELARRLHSLCDAFTVVAPRAQRARELDRALPFRVRRVPVSSDALPFLAVPALLSLAARREYDCILHAQWSTVPGALAARRAGLVRRVVVAAHGRELLLTPFSELGALQRQYSRLRARVLAAADRVVAVSTYTAGLVRDLGVPAGRVLVIPNGTDPQRFCPRSRESARAALGLGEGPILFSVARLVPRKGLQTVLRTLPRLTREVPNLQYIVGGVGPDAQKLADLARSLNVHDHVRFIGRVDENELPHWYAACDVFVMPSRSEPPDVEGFGLVFLEASACGRPVVGARSGGVVDAISHGETGFLVALEDLEELTETLLRLLRDPELARGLGQAGRARVEAEFTWDHVAQRMVTALDDIRAST
jgi:phosphatidyl-myo-inositol dimannoside synthase